MHRKRLLALTFAAAAALALLPGCSSFKLGGACYVPHGTQGACSVTMGADAAQPVAALPSGLLDRWR